MTAILLQEEILRSIDTILQKNAAANPQSRDVACVVTAVKNDLCEIQTDGASRWIKNGVGIPLHAGDAVWVHIPNGSMSDMFIMAKK